MNHYVDFQAASNAAYFLAAFVGACILIGSILVYKILRRR